MPQSPQFSQISRLLRPAIFGQQALRLQQTPFFSIRSGAGAFQHDALVADVRRVIEHTQDRPTKACGVEYLPRQAGAGLPPTLTYADTQQRFTYTYENDADQVGRVTEDE